MLRAALAVTLLLALASPAQAAWERTEALGAPAFTFGSPLLAFSPSGSGLVTWATVGGVPDSPPRTHVAPWPGGGAPAERRTMADEIVVEPLSLGGGRLLFVRARSTGGFGAGPVVLRTSIGTVDGALGKPHRLARFMPSGAYAVAQSRSGEVALVWSQVLKPRRGPLESTFRLRLALMRGRRFGKPVTVGNLGPGEHPGVTSVGVAYDRAGNLAIAFPAVRPAGRRVEALVGRPGHFRRQVLGPQDGVTELVAASSARGRVIVAWQTQDTGEEANLPAKVRVAIREPRASRFTKRALIDRGDARARPPGRLALAVGPTGSAVLAWSQVHASGGDIVSPVVASTAAAHGTFGPPEVLDPNGAAGDVALAPDGSRVVTWARFQPGEFQELEFAYAAVRAETGGFGTAEAVSEANLSGLPAAGFNGTAFVVAWPERTGAEDQSSVVRAAVRGRVSAEDV